jgi:hypothetical protein
MAQRPWHADLPWGVRGTTLADMQGRYRGLFVALVTGVCAISGAGSLFGWPAEAQADWTPYANVSPQDGVSAPYAGMDANGDAVLMWGHGSSDSQIALETRVRRPNGTLTPTQTIGPPGTYGDAGNYYLWNWATPLAVNATGAAAFGWRDNQDRVEGRIRHADGSLSRRVIVGRSADGPARVGIDASGRAVIAWPHLEPMTGRVVLLTRSLSSDGALGPTRVVGQLAPHSQTHSDESFFVMAAGPDGRALFGWSGPDGAAYVRKLSGAGQFGPAQRLSPVHANAFLEGIALNDVGDAIITWIQAVNSPTPDLVGRTRSADATLGPLLDFKDGGGREVALNSSGEAALCGTDSADNLVVRILSPSGALGPPRLVSSQGVIFDCKVGIDSQGNVVVLWYEYGYGRVFARTLHYAGTFGPVVALSSPTLFASEPAFAINSAGDTAATWLAGHSHVIQASFGP